MLIEFCGIPASGKSTLLKGLLGAGFCNGWKLTKSVSQEPINAPKMPHYVTNRPDRRVLYQALRFRTQHADFFREVDRICGSNALEAFFFSLTAQYYQDWIDAGETASALLFDEGFVHRCAALSATKGASPLTLVEFAPLPSLLVVADIAGDVAFDRATRRHGKPEKMRNAVISLHGDEAMFKHRRQVLDEVCDFIETRGVPVVRIQTDQPEADMVAQAMETLGDILPSQ
jgi:thymidylate kinase